MTTRSKMQSSALLIAALSLAASPASAAELPAPIEPSPVAVPAAWSSDAETTAYYGRYYDPYRYRHRRNRVDAGDVIAGVLILGGIAAVASAVKNSNRDDRYRNRDYRDQRYRNDRYRDAPYRNSDATGLDRAASICVSAIERDARVDTVDGVDRTAAGWTVTGRLFEGQGFTCTIGADGRIETIDYGTRTASYGSAYDGTAYLGPDNQLDDDRYRAARADVEGRGGYAVVPDADPVLEGSEPGGPVPAYPGGPLPGDPGYDD
ncbi:MAG: hypothetical protein MK010_02245 [Erythrobacter sp.]|nr:hypothetical protein [Erythrobacter sp.]